jgi:hypothetical protein
MKRLLLVICLAVIPLPLLGVQFSSLRDLLPSSGSGGYGGVDGSEFVFARLIYNEGLGGGGLANFRGFRRGGGSWRTDWPEADKHLGIAIDRMSNVRVVLDQDIAIEIMDPNLFSYPFLYALEVGRGMNLSQEEADRLREYMARGGFLVIDDFWGSREWQNWAIQLGKIFPEKEPEPIPIAHPLFHSFFDIDEILQIPNVNNGCRGGPTYEQDGYVPYALGMFDDDRRLMMLINYNTDIGDAWEHADQPCYPNEFADYAFRIAINYIIYSMTH